MSSSSITEKTWYVYVLRCVDGSLYTGIATSLEKRIAEHNSGTTGAKYTRARRPVILAYSETCDSRSAAARREACIKSMTKSQKEALVSSTSRLNKN